MSEQRSGRTARILLITAVCLIATHSLGSSPSEVLPARAAGQPDSAPSEREDRMVFPGEAWAVATPESQGIASDRLDKALAHLREVCGEHGTDKVVIVRNGYVLWQGPKADEPFLVWSCTKSFLSTALGLLWDDGVVTPESRAALWLPQIAEHYPDVTLEHLATFTSGYAHENDPLKPAPPRYAPGEAFHYSKESDLLAAALTRAADQSLEALFFERIGEPIGITRKDMDWGEHTHRDGLAFNGGSGHPGGGVAINALAMARFGWLMAADGRWKDKQLISQRYLDYATAPRTATDLPPFKPDAWYVSLPGNYGLNWWTNGPMPDGRRRWPHAPNHTFAAQGNRNNVCFVIPEWNMVIVRLGHDRIIDMAEYDEVFRLLDPTNPFQPRRQE